jgi:hypothetical protein
VVCGWVISRKGLVDRPAVRLGVLGYISVSAVMADYGFALTATPFCRRPKGSKRLCPSIRCLAVARHALTPALLRGPAAIGHPWPGAATAASLPRCPLRNACVRPLGKGQADQDQKPKQQQDQKIAASFHSTAPTGGRVYARFSPLNRPSVSSPAAFDLEVHAPSRGRVEVLRSGQPGMDAGLAAPGHGWPMAAGPRSRTGARACRA